MWYLHFGWLVEFYGISTIVGYIMPNPLYTQIYTKYIWFGLVWFYGISTIVGYIMPNPLYTYILIYICFGLIWWHLNHCRLFNAKSSLYTFIKYMCFGLVWFYGISTIVGYIMPNPLYTYILIYICFGLIWWHLNHCRLFNAKSSLYTFIKYMCFSLVWFYGISTIVGYIMQNPLYTYMLNKNDLYKHIFLLTVLNEHSVK